MLLVDDLLLAPIWGLLWLFEKIHDAVQEEIAGEADAITAELRELYMMLETGRITETEFGEKERPLLDRLDAIHERGSESDEEDVDEEDVDEEDEAGNETEEDGDDDDGEGEDQ